MTMKTLRLSGMILLAMLMAIGLNSCSKEYDDSAVWRDIEQLKQKVAELETICRKTNENISSLQKIAGAMEDADYVTDLTPITNDGVTVGYQVTFAKKGSVSIYNGKDGETPVVGVKQDTDGKFYWTVNGEYITVKGQKIPAQAEGGESASVPQFKIEDGYWYISYNGTDWTSVGKATADEEAGGSGCVFSSVTQDDDYVYFTLSDGTVIKIAKEGSDNDNEKGDDENDEGKDDAEETGGIVGKWMVIDVESESAFGDVEEEIEPGDWMEFKSNNTCSWRQAGEVVNGKYSIENNVLSIYDIDNSDYIPFMYQIEELTSTRMVLSVDWGELLQCTYILEKEKGSDVDEVVVTVNQAGTLKKILTDYDADAILSLAVSGELDARDFNYLKNRCTSLQDVDLSGTTIVAYTGNEGTNEGYAASYAANEIPLGAFFYWVPADEGMPSLQRVVIPASTVVIQRNAFARAYNLTDINFPEGLKTIGYVAFALCSSLEEIYLPSTLKEIGQQAFHNCNGLKEVHVASSTPASLGYDAFGEIHEGAVLYVPKGALEIYQKSDWNNYFLIKEE